MSALLSPKYLRAWAFVSKCERYRWLLGREWDAALPFLWWCLLNPSKADGARDDPTVRRCVGFARRLGFGGIGIVNLFAWRTTFPVDLRAAYAEGEPVTGNENDGYLRDVAAKVWLEQHREPRPLIIVGWGANASEPFIARRAGHVLGILRSYAGSVSALSVTRAGAPGHPLMLPYAVTPQQFNPQS